MPQLIDALVRAAATSRGLRFHAPGSSTRVSYQTLLEQSRARATALREQLGEEATPVVVVAASPRGFVEGFWTTLLAGHTPAPMAPPQGPREEAQRRLSALFDALPGAALLLADCETFAHPAKTAIALEALPEREAIELGDPAPSEFALLQFTSGSTRAPAGVALSHAALLSNTAQLREAAPFDEHGVELGWMPLYHDMGLIGAHLMALCAGAEQHRMATRHYLRRPLDWLRIASEIRATTLTSTPSALRLLAAHLPRLEAGAVDLSAVTCLGVGAEPLDAALIDHVGAALARFGFEPSALRPCYGLAEASVGVCVTTPAPSARWRRFDRDALSRGVAAPCEPDDAATTLATCGAPLRDIDLRIVDAKGAVCEAGRVGEVRLRGPNLGAGYLGADGLRPLDLDAEGFLRSGDLGFLWEGELFLCGRNKESFSFEGRQVFLTDIEATARETAGIADAVLIPRLRDNGALDHGELLCVVLPGAEAQVESARQRVHAVFGLPIASARAVERGALLRTTSGKLRRDAIAAHFVALATDGDLADRIERIWREVLRREAPVPRDRAFRALGGSSLQAYEVLARLETELGHELPESLLHRAESIDAMAALIRGAPLSRAAGATRRQDATVAIVGVALRFPGGDDLASFFEATQSEAELLREVPSDRWEDAGALPAQQRRGGFLDAPYDFDPAWFHLDADAARLTDPQQRLLLELGHELLEGAGYGEARRRGLRIGVYAGSNQLPYVDAAGGSDAPNPAALVGNLMNMLAARLAHELGLQGPALGLDTACSTALVALHLGREAIRRGECDLAIVGGVNLNLTSSPVRYFDAAGVISPQGRCRALGADADGTLLSDGAGLVLLAPLEDARRRGDRCLAVLRGSAINNDGGALGPMVPNPEGQRAVLRAAYADAGLAPLDIDLLETHATGTPVGDGVERRALRGLREDAAEPLRITASKSRVGHLLAASGLVGLARVIEGMRRGELPRSALGPQGPAPDNDFEVVGAAAPWPERDGPRRAAVSAFGFGGTNAHVILEAPGASPERARRDPPALPLLLSAPDEAHLRAQASALAEGLKGADRGDLLDLCRELARGRSHVHGCRFGRVVADPADAHEALRALSDGQTTGWLRGETGRRHRRVALLFPGQGAQYLGQASAFAQHWPQFAEHFAAGVARSGRDELAGLAENRDGDAGALLRTDCAQPLLVAHQLAVADALSAAGLRAEAVLGHSVGEIAAASLAGAFGRDDAVAFAAARGEAMHAHAEPGGMLAITAAPAQVQSLLEALETRAEIACLNGPRQTVVAGDPASLDAVRDRCAQAGLSAVGLATPYPFHGPGMDAVLPHLPPAPTSSGATDVSWFSSATGRRSDSPATCDWRRHARAPVRFADALSALVSEGIDTLVEVGPGATLRALSRGALPAGSECIALSPPRSEGDDQDWRTFMRAITALWARGVALDFDALPLGDGRPATPLPPPAYLRQTLRAHRPRPTAPVPAQHLHRVCWHSLALPDATLAPRVWVQIGDQGPDFAAERRIVVQAASRFSRLDEDRFALDTTQPRHWRWLAESLAEAPEVLLVDDAVDPFGLRALVEGLPGRLHHLTTRAHEDSAGIRQLLAAFFEEQPARRGALLDAPAPAPARAISAALAAPPPHPVRWRSGGWERPGTEAITQVSGSFAAPGCCAIAGVSGELGRALALRLAERGCRRIIGISRTAPPEDLARALSALGATLEHLPCDIADPGAVPTLRDAFAQRSPRLVIHAAGSLRAGSFAQRSEAELRAVLGTKQTGSQQLLAALEDAPDAELVLISSLAGVLPHLGRGVADYAAANAWQDAFSARKRRAGHRIRALAFTAWQDRGLSRRGDVPLAGLDERAALDAFEAAMTQPPGELLVAPSSDLSWAAPAPTPHSVRSEAPAPPPPPKPATPRSSDSLEALLRNRLATIAGVPPEAVDPKARFASLGVDSLAAVDVMKELAERTGQTLSPTLLFEHDSLERLLAYLRADAAPAQRSRTLLGAQLTFYANQRIYEGQPCYVFLEAQLEGTVDVAALQRGVQQLHAHHPMLDVRFEHSDEGPQQIQGPRAQPTLEVVDLSALDTDGYAREQHRRSEIHRQQVLPLNEAPLARWLLLLGPGNRHHLALHVHHIVADAWSAWLLMDGLLRLHAGDEGSPPDTHPFDLMDAMLAWEQGDAGTRSTRYWEAQLDGAQPLALPFDAEGDSGDGTIALRMQRLPAALTERLEQAARRAGLTRYQLVFAGYLRFLHRLTGARDLLVRSANARRELPVTDAERVVGSFADSLPLRVRLGDDVDASLLAATREACLGAQRHAAISSLTLARLAPRDAAGPKGLSQAGFSFPSFPAATRYGDLQVHSVRGGAAGGFTQLGVIAWPFDGALHLSWSYPEAALREATLARWQAELEASLVAVCELAEGEVRPESRLVHLRVLQSAAEHATRLAIAAPDGERSYQALAENIAARAHALQARGIQTGDRVGVLAHPGAAASETLLAVNAAGACWVPLDPAWPRARIHTVAQHARLALLLHDAAGATQVPEGLEALDFNALIAAPAPEDWHPAAPPTSAPAYIMYTSGTTGRPKGVVVSHDALAHFHDWVQGLLELGPGDRYIQTSPLSFGGAIRQIFSPLLAGATVRAVERDVVRDPAALLALMERERVTLWNSVPTLWRRLMDALDDLDREGRAPALGSLRAVLLGGEEVPASMVRRWRRRFGRTHRLFNLYGSTETVVNATYFEVEDTPPEEEAVIPIGRACQGNSTQLLDGVLHVGGPSLASGYFDDAEATAAAFIEHPRYGRLYRTGDRVRARDDGAWVYLGREDLQVQVHGNRVEPLEVEAALARLVAPSEVAVVGVRERDAMSLHAFVAPPPQASSGELLDGLRAALPAFMVPRYIHGIDALPRTPAGKLDRRALAEAPPSPSPHRPSEALTEQVAAAWREVLGHDRFGPEDDFFEVGGDSIRVLDVLHVLGREIPRLPRPREVYAHRSVEALAQLIAGLDAGPEVSAAPRVPSEDDAPFPLASAQIGFLLASEGAGRSIAIWSAAIPLRGEFSDAQLQESFDTLRARHDMLRVRFERSPTGWRQRTPGDGGPELRIVDATRLTEAARDEHVEAALHRVHERSRPIDDPALMDVEVHRIAADRSVLIVSLPHLIADGWSLSRLGDEWSQLLAGKALPPLATRFRDVVAAERTRAPREADLKWWRDHFATPWPDAKLPDTGMGRRTQVVLAPEELSLLRREAAQQRCSLNTLLLARWYETLREATGCEDLPIAVSTHGRDLDLENADRVFGCFASAWPLRLGPDCAEPRGIDARFAEASAHAALSTAQIIRALPRHPGAPFPPGARFFHASFEMGAGARGGSFDWERGRFRFSLEGSETQASLNAFVGKGLHLHLNGAASEPVRAGLLNRLLHRLRPPRRIDAAIVAYLPSKRRLRALLPALGDAVDLDAGLSLLFPEGRPRLVEVLDTPLGRSGCVLLPGFADDLDDPEIDLEERVRQAVEVAQQHGARAVSLGGLLPAKLRFGHGVPSDAALTTGHATTAAAIVLGVEDLLRRGGRRFAGERLAVVGFGAMGQALLPPLLARLGVPESLSIHEQPERLRSTGMQAAVQALSGVRAHCVASPPDGLDPSVYEATLILGASNRGGLLDVTALRPGTLVFDDSFPSLFDLATARARNGQDIACLTAGQLAVNATCSWRETLPGVAPAQLETAIAHSGFDALAGCRLEAALVASDILAPTLGLAGASAVEAAIAVLEELGIPPRAPHLHGSETPLPPKP